MRSMYLCDLYAHNVISRPPVGVLCRSPLAAAAVNASECNGVAIAYVDRGTGAIARLLLSISIIEFPVYRNEWLQSNIRGGGAQI